MALDSRLQDCKYRNWVRASLGLEYLKQGLSSYVTDEAAQVHATFIGCIRQKCNIPNVQCSACQLKTLLPAHVANNTPCPHPGRCCCFKRNKIPCRNGICGELYDTIVSEHNLNNPIWNSTDSLKWTTSPWELAKCYLSSSGYKDKQSADECDASGLLSICINCKIIRSKISDISQFEQARTARNDILHSSLFELEDATLADHISVMLKVLNDPIVQQQPDATAAITHLNEILKDERVINKNDETEAREMALAAVKARIVEVKTEIDQLKASDTQRKEELEQIQKDLIKMKDNHDDAMKKQEADIKVLYSRQDVTDKRGDALHARQDTLETHHADIEKRQDVLAKRQDDAEKHHGGIGTRQDDIGKRQDNIEKRQDCTEKQHAEIRKHQDDIKKRQDEADEHHAEIRKHQDDLKKRQDDADEHHAEIRKHQDDLKKRQDDADEHHAEIKKHQDELKKCQDDADEHHAEIRKHQDDLKKRQDNVEKRQDCTEEHHAEIRKHQDDIKKRQNDADEHHAEIKKHQDDIKKRQDDTENRIAKASESTQKHNELWFFEKAAHSLFGYDKDLQRYLVDTYKKHYLKTDLSPIFPEVEHIDEMFIPINLSSTYKGRNKVKKEIRKMSELFEGNGNKIQLTFIAADAGMGKTTLCKKIISTWVKAHDKEFRKSLERHITPHQFMAEEEIWRNMERENVEFMKSFTYLFFVSLRSARSNCEIERMVEKELLNTYHLGIFRHIIKERKERCLFILDGLDEWDPGSAQNDFQSHGRSSDLPFHNNNCTLLYTTRPWKLADRPIQDNEARIELKGLTNKSSEWLIYKMLTKLNSQQNKSLEYMDFLSELETRHLCHFQTIPIMIKLLVCLWFDSQELSDKTTSIYCDVLNLIMKVFSNRGRQAPANIAQRNLPPLLSTGECVQYANILLALCNFSHKTYMAADSLVFTMGQIQQQGMCPEEIQVCLDSGLLSKTAVVQRATDIQQQISYIHKTFQEFFVALHISTTTGHLSRLLEKCNTRKALTEQFVILSFLCGLDDNAAKQIAEHVYGCSSIDRDTLNDRDVQRLVFSLIKETQHLEKNSIPLRDIHLVESNASDETLVTEWLDVTKTTNLDCKNCRFSEQFCQFLPSQSTLRRLFLEFQTDRTVSHSQVTNIMSMPTLIDITLSGVQCNPDTGCGCAITDQATTEINNGTKKLMKTMNAKTCRIVKTRHVLKHIQAAPNMEELEFRDNQIDAEDLADLIQMLQCHCNLKILNIELSVGTNMPHSQVTCILSIPTLIDITLSGLQCNPDTECGCVITDQATTEIKNSTEKTMKKMNAKTCRIVKSRHVLSHIEAARNMEELELRENQIDAEDLADLIQMLQCHCNLKILNIELSVGTSMSHSQVTSMMCLPTLTDIKLSGVKSMADTACGCATTYQPCADGMQNRKIMKQMNAKRCHVDKSSQVLNHILEAPNIETFSLDDSDVDQERLACIMMACAQLQYVTLSNVIIPEHCLKLGDKCRNIQLVILNKVTVSGATVKSLINSIPPDNPRVWLILSTVFLNQANKLQAIWKVKAGQSGFVPYDQTVINRKTPVGEVDVKTLAGQIYRCHGHVRNIQIQDTIFFYINESQQVTEIGSVPLQDINILPDVQANNVGMIKYVDPLTVKTLVLDGQILREADTCLQMNRLEEFKVTNCDFTEQFTPTMCCRIAKSCARTLSKLNISAQNDIHLSHSQATSLLCLPVLSDITMRGVKCEPDSECGCDSSEQTHGDGNYPGTMIAVKSCRLNYPGKMIAVKHCRLTITSQVLCQRIIRSCKGIRIIHIENSSIDDLNIQVLPQIKSLQCVKLKDVSIRAGSLKSLIQSVPSDHPGVRIELCNVVIVKDAQSSWLKQTWNIKGCYKSDYKIVVNDRISHKPRIITLSRGMKVELYLYETDVGDWEIGCDVYSNHLGEPDIGYREKLLMVDGKQITQGMCLTLVEQYLEEARVEAERTGKDRFDLKCQFLSCQRQRGTHSDFPDFIAGGRSPDVPPNIMLDPNGHLGRGSGSGVDVNCLVLKVALLERQQQTQSSPPSVQAD